MEAPRTIIAAPAKTPALRPAPEGVVVDEAPAEPVEPEPVEPVWLAGVAVTAADPFNGFAFDENGLVWLLLVST